MPAIDTIKKELDSPIILLLIYFFGIMHYAYSHQKKQIFRYLLLSKFNEFDTQNQISFTANEICKICFVSAFFAIKSAVQRHPISLYESRAKRFFESFISTVPLFIFTPMEGFEMLSRSLANLTLNIHFITKYDNIFNISKLYGYKKQYEKLVSQTKVDFKVTPEIGAIWNGKFIFLEEVFNQYYPNSEFYFWIDIGIIKNEEFFNKSQPFIWPDVNRILKIFTYTDPNTNQTAIYQKILFWLEEGSRFSLRSISRVTFPIWRTRIAAGCFGGPIDALKSFVPEYWRLHDLLLSKNKFAVREEWVLAVYVIIHKEKSFFINISASICYCWHAAVTFISKNNICEFPNQVLHFETYLPTSLPIPRILDSWS